jgi:hypothetical protein
LRNKICIERYWQKFSILSRIIGAELGKCDYSSICRLEGSFLNNRVFCLGMIESSMRDLIGDDDWITDVPLSAGSASTIWNFAYTEHNYPFAQTPWSEGMILHIVIQFSYPISSPIRKCRPINCTISVVDTALRINHDMMPLCESIRSITGEFRISD